MNAPMGPFGYSTSWVARLEGIHILAPRVWIVEGLQQVLNWGIVRGVANEKDYVVGDDLLKERRGPGFSQVCPSKGGAGQYEALALRDAVRGGCLSVKINDSTHL